ncbi:MAG: hypothetical protein AUJ85_10765 [Elusimicrobia bacterium CG1_02_37_114]|nr:MAG: hypothetical protein AUJ85_10765 [Elusimicrobia bacterium CG1_02_37_114]
MNQKNILHPFLKPIKDLSELIKVTNNKGIIIGGIAASILGKPRFTSDVDVLILFQKDDIAGFIKQADSCGIIPRITNPIRFALKNKVILLKHKETGINIDIAIGLLPFEHEIVNRSKIFDIEGIKINLPQPEDLIILKAIAHRPMDLEDIRMIIKIYPRLDLKRIEKTVKEFASFLEMPELWTDLTKILK